MGRCHVLWFSFFVWTIGHPSLSISSFLKFVPVSHLYLDRPSRPDGFSSYLEVDHRKWEPWPGNEFTFQWVLLVFPFYESTCHASFWFPIVILSQVFSSPIVHLASSAGIQSHQSSNSSVRYIFKSVFISLMFTFRWFPSMLFHGILFWLGFFPSV